MEAVQSIEIPLDALAPEEVEIAVNLAAAEGMSLREFILSAVANRNDSEGKKVANFSRTCHLELVR